MFDQIRGCTRLCLFVLVHLSPAAWAAHSVPAGYRLIASELGVPHELLYAIALTESGKRIDTDRGRRPWPWTLNIAGQGHWYPSRDQAWTALNDALAQGVRSIDIGLMQVNWRYHRDRLGSPWQALEPYHNLRIGTQILRECYADRQDWWESTGCYHAPSHPERAHRYRARVESHWRNLSTQERT